jgi:hypothetical protein
MIIPSQSNDGASGQASRRVGVMSGPSELPQCRRCRLRMIQFRAAPATHKEQACCITKQSRFAENRIGKK